MAHKILEFKSKPLLCLCSSKNKMQVLIENSKKASHSNEFVLLLKYDKRIIQRILPAFMNASIRVSDGIARTKSLQIEMLLLVCGTMSIGKALEACGARNKENFLLFATDKSLLESFSKQNGVKIGRRIELSLDLIVAGDVTMTELLNE